MIIERTLVLLKPDAVKRGIIGEILHRFERSSLKIIGLKLIAPDVGFAKKHYPISDSYFKSLGDRTVSDCDKFKIDVVANMGTSDPLKIGKMVWKWLVEFLTSGPVLAVVMEGPHAIENVRTMVGNTVPLYALPGTIRGDFGLDSAIGANSGRRAIYNLIHASGTIEEAKREIDLWFSSKELLSYKRVHDDLYSY